MFTGIIQHTGQVTSLQPAPGGASLQIDTEHWLHSPRAGESIAVNGCCLTLPAAASKSTNSVLSFDVIHQTLKMTTLGGLKEGDRVNLEPAVTPATLLGGHIVQGHVDGVGAARRANSAARGEVRLRIEPPPHLMDSILPQGSIAIDGVSLTVADVGDAWFEVALIPETLARTNLARIGDEPTPVNLETDYLVKAVVHVLRRNRAI